MSREVRCKKLVVWLVLFPGSCIVQTDGRIPGHSELKNGDSFVFNQYDVWPGNCDGEVCGLCRLFGWAGQQTLAFAAGLDSLMKCANLDSTRSWRQVYLSSCNAVGQPLIIIIIIIILLILWNNNNNNNNNNITIIIMNDREEENGG